MALHSERSIVRQSRTRVLADGIPALGVERFAKRLFDIVAATTSLYYCHQLFWLLLPPSNLALEAQFFPERPFMDMEIQFEYLNSDRYRLAKKLTN